MSFDDKFERFGGIGFAIVGIALLVAGITYLLPLEDSTKTMVYISCYVGVILAGLVMVPLGLMSFVVGVCKGTRDAVRGHRERTRRATMTPAEWDAHVFGRGDRRDT